jgi:hypothetical protein
MVTLAALACCKAAKAAQLALNLPNLVSFSQPCNIRPKSGWRLQSVQARIPSCRQTGHYLGCSPKQHKCSVLGAASNFHTVRVVYREHLGVIGVTCKVATTGRVRRKRKLPNLPRILARSSDRSFFRDDPGALRSSYQRLSD